MHFANILSVTAVRQPEIAPARTKSQNADGRQKLGRLTIFFGMSPGVGKTYAMLKAAREEALLGHDVVIGYVQTHDAKATTALTKNLGQMPGCIATDTHSDVILDLDGLLARQPHIAVVDELGRVNPSGSRHVRSYQDVQELLSAGIDVFTTLNLQEVASEADIVRRITGTKASSTVPDPILNGAEFNLVDIAPAQFLTRLRVQMPYLVQDPELSAVNFFAEANLTTLRDRTWHFVADRRSRETREYVQKHQLRGAWKSGPVLLGLVVPGIAAEPIVHFTRKMAESGNSPWLILYVETPRPIDESDHSEITRALALAQEMGAEVITTTDEDLINGVLRVAAQRNATQVILGKSAKSEWQLFSRDSFVQTLLRKSRDFEICLVPTQSQEPKRTVRRANTTKVSGWLPYIVSAAVVAAITIVAFFWSAKIGGPHVAALIYLLAVVALGLFTRRGPTLLAATLSALLWNYFILPPIFAFQVAHVEDALLLGTYFVVALILSQLTTQIRVQQQGERLREERATALYLLTRELNEAFAPEQIVQRATQNMGRAFKARVQIFSGSPSGNFEQLPFSGDTSSLGSQDQMAIAWVFKHGQRAGKFTTNFPSADLLYVPLTTTGGVMGVMGLELTQPLPLTIHQFNLLDSFCQQIAFALDRHRLREISEHARLLAESERLSKTLLDSMSHEMRTPIAILKTAAMNLTEVEGYSRDEIGKDIVAAINDATERLNHLVGNVLDITRLESGHIKARFTDCPVSDLVHLALNNTKASLANHNVCVDIAPDLPIVTMDFVLMEQALTNLLSNAAFHTPSGTEVLVSARIEREILLIEVADRGLGIKPESMPRLFEKFYRGPSAPTGGSGLGLSLVKGFIEAQGGTVTVANRSEGGAIFSIQLPLAKMPALQVE